MPDFGSGNRKKKNNSDLACVNVNEAENLTDVRMRRGQRPIPCLQMPLHECSAFQG